jgi:ankyrin repeat protein
MSYADPSDAQNDDGRTALILAAQNGYLPIVAALLDAGADAGHEMSDGRTALILAAQHGHLPIVEALLKAGADPDHATTDGSTALILAAQSGHAAVVEALLRSGADPNHAAASDACETYGTAEELDAFLDRLLQRGDELKRDIADLHTEIRKSM